MFILVNFSGLEKSGSKCLLYLKIDKHQKYIGPLWGEKCGKTFLLSPLSSNMVAAAT